MRNLKNLSVNSRNRGHSLVELLIASTILIIVGLAVVAFIRRSSVSAVVNADRSNAYQMVNIIQADLRNKEFSKLTENNPYSYNKVGSLDKITAEATVGPANTSNVCIVNATVTWRGHDGYAKFFYTTFNLTEEGGHRERAGKLWVIARDAESTTNPKQGIPNYRFCAVPNVLLANPEVSYRVLARTCEETDADGKAFFKNLEEGTWFIFPMGRPGDYLGSILNPTPEPISPVFTPAQEAYPAVVRHFDYDFADEPVGATWKNSLTTRIKESSAYQGQNPTVPPAIPNLGNLISIVKGKTYNLEHPESEWAKPNKDGTLVFEITRAGSIQGTVAKADSALSSDPDDWTNGPFAQPRFDFFPQNFPNTFDPTKSMNRFSIITEPQGSNVRFPFQFSTTTYISYEYYGILLQHFGKHLSVPPFSSGVLNKSPNELVPSLFLRRVADPTGGDPGKYHLRAAQGGLAMAAGYGNNEYKNFSLTPTRVSLQNLPSFTNPVDGVLKGFLLENGKLVDRGPNYESIATFRSGEVPERYDFTLVPLSALADFKFVNPQGLQFRASFDCYSLAGSGSTGTCTIQGNGSVDTQTGLRIDPPIGASVAKSVIPSGSATDLKNIRLAPTNMGAGITTTPVRITGEVWKLDFDPITQSRTDNNNMGAGASLKLETDYLGSAGPFDVGGTGSIDKEVDLPNDGTYGSITKSVFIVPNNTNDNPPFQVTFAQLASGQIDSNALIYTTDNNFRCYSGCSWFNITSNSVMNNVKLQARVTAPVKIDVYACGEPLEGAAVSVADLDSPDGYSEFISDADGKVTGGNISAWLDPNWQDADLTGSYPGCTHLYPSPAQYNMVDGELIFYGNINLDCPDLAPCRDRGCTNYNAENYKPGATIDDGSCILWGCTDSTAPNFDPSANRNSGCIYSGCTDPNATNYNWQASINDGSCVYGPLPGCMDPDALNYNPAATVDNGSCVAKIWGCRTNGANNFNPLANIDIGGPFGSCTFDPIAGCMDPSMYNYNPMATLPGPCTPRIYGCMDGSANNYNGLANTPSGCTYLCTDPNAFNYNQAAVCIAKTYGCKDTNANNYSPTANTANNSLCTYTPICTDPNANNVGQPLPCTYSLCTDPTANNVGDPLPCTFDAVDPCPTCPPCICTSGFGGACTEPVLPCK